MVAGGSVVAMAYQARTDQAAQMLEASYKQRAALAGEQLAMAMKLLKGTQERVAVGAASTMELVDAQLKVVNANAELKSLELQIEEVRLSGHEPVTQVSAPLVSGRDFVSERWRIEMAVPEAALNTEQTRLAAAQRRFAAGMADGTAEIDPIVAHLAELRATIETYKRKLDIRQKFLNKGMDAGMADLRVLEVDADQRVGMLTSRIEVSRKEVDRVKARVAVGASPPLELAGAELQLHQIEFELSKAQYDLALIRKQIAK
jgi:outer membrane protein TolC